MDQPKPLGLHFGVMCDSIERQLRARFKRLPRAFKQDLERHEKSAYSITYLKAHLVLSEKEADNAYKRLMKQIAESISKHGLKEKEQ